MRAGNASSGLNGWKLKQKTNLDYGRNHRTPSLTAQRFSCVPSMFDSLGVKIPYPT
jgi:hypothetical protein